MKLLKKGYLILLVVLLGLGLVGCSNNTNKEQIKLSPDTVIATVNNTEITQKQLDQQLVYLDYHMQWEYGSEYMKSQEAMDYYNEQKYLLVEDLVNRRVIINKAPELGVEITDEMVEEELEIFKAEYNTEEEFNNDLQISGLTIEEFKLIIKEDLIFRGVIIPLTADIKVEEGEAEEFYASNISSFTTPAGAEMSHIVLEDEAKAIEARTKYDEGKTFDELSAEYATDETKYPSGLLGYIPYDYETYPALPFDDKEFMLAVKDLEEGEVSQPVKTNVGWHIIQVKNVNKEDIVVSFDELKSDIEAKIIDDKANMIVGEKVAEWRSECDVDIKKDLI